MDSLLEIRDQVLGPIADFVFGTLGVPFTLFCFGTALFALAARHSEIKALLKHWRAGRDYHPGHPLTEWEELEQSEQGFVHAVLFAAVVMFVLGIVALIAGW
jgi:predicted PurR-regulated permease PerM